MTRFDPVVVRLAALVVAVAAAMVVLAACGGTQSTAREGLPADFPSEQVPLIDGPILMSGGSVDHWDVTVQAPANQGNPIERAVHLLTDAGYQEQGRTTESGQTVVRLSETADGATYWVTLGISPAAAAGATSVFYQVAKG